jgi:uncharacterized protein Yka (UPF0111/DUF47 family)
MADYMTLLGAEDVVRAGREVKAAADEMSRAAAEIAEAVRQLRVVLEDDRAAREAFR